MGRQNWSTIGGIAGAISVPIALLAAWFTYMQLPERRAALRLEVSTVQFVNRSPGQWIAAPTLGMKNDGTSRAERVAIEFQHWPLSWTGVVPSRETFDILPGETKRFLISADTVADPNGTLASGKHVYFALRVKWVNSATRKPGCEVYYLDIRLAPGPEVGTRLPMLDVLGERPATLPAPEIAGCPRA